MAEEPRSKRLSSPKRMLDSHEVFRDLLRRLFEGEAHRNVQGGYSEGIGEALFLPSRDSSSARFFLGSKADRAARGKGSPSKDGICSELANKRGDDA